MRIIAKSTLRKFWEQSGHHDAEQPLKAWFEEARRAVWKNPNDIKKQYCNASIIKNNRVVFNIAGNKYRLIAAIQYRFGIIYICFINSHREYDKINAEEIWS